MAKKPIRTVEDFEAFFTAWNERDWDEAFAYLSEDCAWHASERAVTGREAMLDYWLNRHRAIKETLGKPRDVVFGDGVAYLQVPIALEFLEDGEFLGKKYRKGTVITLWCADAYAFAEDGTIKSCRVYMRFD